MKKTLLLVGLLLIVSLLSACAGFDNSNYRSDGYGAGGGNYGGGHSHH